MPLKGRVISLSTEALRVAEIAGRHPGQVFEQRVGDHFYSVTAINKNVFAVDLVVRAGESELSERKAHARMVFRRDSSGGWSAMYMDEADGKLPRGNNALRVRNDWGTSNIRQLIGARLSSLTNLVPAADKKASAGGNHEFPKYYGTPVIHHE